MILCLDQVEKDGDSQEKYQAVKGLAIRETSVISEAFWDGRDVFRLKTPRACACYSCWVPRLLTW
jgi:hypothetical protein